MRSSSRLVTGGAPLELPLSSLHRRPAMENSSQKQGTLEPVADEEIADVASLITRAFRSTGWHTEEELVTAFTLTEEQLRSQTAITKPNGALLQWRDGRGRVGCVLLRRVNEQKWRFAFLAIEPTLQTSGLGHALLGMIEEYSQQRGATTLCMNAMITRKNLIAWYTRRGYKLTGETEPFVHQADRHGDLLRDDLCFVVLEKSFS